MVSEDCVDSEVLLAKLQKRFPYANADERLTLQTLNGLLSCIRMKALLMAYSEVKACANTDCELQCCESILLINEVHSSAVSDHHFKNDIDCELCELSDLFFSSPHLLAVLQCQDQITKKKYEPELPNLEVCEWISQDDDESMKVVRLMKGSDPLGATIAVDEESGNIIIARILKGGVADRSGLVHINDILVSINKVPTKDRTPDKVIHQLTEYRGPLTLCLIPAESSFLPRGKTEDDVLYIRAKLDYNPQDDNLIPCAEAGLQFKKNDILRVLSREDGLWWQASLHQSGVGPGTNSSSLVTARAGLVPSEKLQRKRQNMGIIKSSSSPSGDSTTTRESNSSLSAKSGKSAWALLRQSFRIPKKKGSTIHGTTQYGHRLQSMPIYEEVRSFPPPVLQTLERKRFRPLVLIGPQGVGRNVLKDRLIDTDPSHFGVPVPHTSRQKVPGDEDGRDYHFVTREYMENGIQRGMFLEYGEYKGNIYGTSLSAVEDVIASHQVCVLTPYPQALKLLRNRELKPYVIFVKPPSPVGSGSQSFESETKFASDRRMATPLMLEEWQDLSERGLRIEAIFGQLFDYTILSHDEDSAFSELLEVAASVENEHQWIPSSWDAVG